MNNLRWNSLALKWIAHAPGRLARPRALEQRTTASSRSVTAESADSTGLERDPTCPLCPGNEKLTPPETWALRPSELEPDTEGWLVRAVPNLYPAVSGDGLTHEVIVHSPRHSADLSSASREELEDLAIAWAQRLSETKSDPSVKFCQISVNHGRVAGASLEHPHSQLIGLSFVPPVAEAELLSTSINCPICDLVKARLAEGLILEENELFAVAPSWSEFPYEVLVAPTSHTPQYELDENKVALTVILGKLLKAIRSIEGVDAYNVILHTAPQVTDGHRFHWHLHIMARVGTIAGIELGAGLPVQVVDPEQAASIIRKAIP